MKKLDFTKVRDSSLTFFTTLQNNGKYFIFLGIVALFFTAIACMAAFFNVVNKAEQVLVPNVVGKELSTALLEMQVKELYPKIQLRNTENQSDKGLILEQDPVSGTIAKAGRRITLIVGNGVMAGKVDNFVGRTLTDAKKELQTPVSASSPRLAVIAPPLYKIDNAAAGTILAQNPPAGTSITEQVNLTFFVSRGTQAEQTTPPQLVGLSVENTLKKLASSKVIFDFTLNSDNANETTDSVVSQEVPPTENVAIYTRVAAVITLPAKPVQDKIYGLFTAQLPEYPYPVPILLEAKMPDGKLLTVIEMKHPGGYVSIPYAVTPQTELILLVAGQEKGRVITG